MQESGRSTKYERVKSLGAEGPFEVEVAWPERGKGVEQTVLLKRLRPGWQVHPEHATTYVNDARAMAGIFHPNLLRVIDVGTLEGRIFIVYEHLHAVSVYSVLKRLQHIGQPLTPDVFFEVVSACCSGLERAARGIEGGQGALVHGALGPGHVLIAFDGKIKIKDFGVLRLYRAKLNEAEAVARMGLAPEIQSGHLPDVRSDLWALGMMALQLLDASAGSLGESAESEMRGLFEKLTVGDPARRYQQASDFFRDFSAVQAGSRKNLASGSAGDFARSLYEVRPGSLGPKDQAESDNEVGWLDPALFWGSAGNREKSEQPASTKEHGRQSEESAKARDVHQDVHDVHNDEIGEVVSLPADRQAPLPEPPVRAQQVTEKPTQPEFELPRARPKIPIRSLSSKKSPKSRSVTRWLYIAVTLAGVAGAAVLFFTNGDAPPVTEDHPPDKGLSDTIEKPALHSRDKQPRELQPAVASDKVETGQVRTEGSLTLTSDPPGVAVFINSEKHGATPTKIGDLAIGAPVEIRLESEGFKTWSQEITLDAAAPAREIHADLHELVNCENGSGWIYVSSHPAGATVELDGRRLPGKTPLVIDDVCATIMHEIRVRAAGHDTWWDEVLVKKGEVLNLNIDLGK